MGGTSSSRRVGETGTDEEGTRRKKIHFNRHDASRQLPLPGLCAVVAVRDGTVVTSRVFHLITFFHQLT